MQISSPAFIHKGEIPKQYTCDGENVNPELVINEVPNNTKSLALIMDDPDAPFGTFTHWVIWNMSPKIKTIPFNAKNVGIEGVTSFNQLGYQGPCPPPGTPHRYFFKLYALDTTLDLPSGSNRHQLEVTMKPDIVGHAELIGIYKR